MYNNEQLYEAIEEAARNKTPVRLKEGETLRTTMIDSKKFLVEDLLWRDERGHICQVILEAGFEKKGDYLLTGMYVFGNKALEGFGSGRKTMFRKNNRYNIYEDVHEQDNIPNPFEDFTFEELNFLREHKRILEMIKLR